MTFTLLVGYALCFLNIVFLAESKCKDSSYGRMTDLNTLVFLICASYTLLFSHIVLFGPMMKDCCKRCNRSLKSIAPREQTEDPNVTTIDKPYAPRNNDPEEEEKE